jgi:hypothetical protein
MKLLTPLLLAASCFAESRYHRHNFYLIGGPGIPGSEVGQFFRTAPLFGFNYGYRFHRLFQVESGLDTVFQAADVRDFLRTDFGPLRIRDYQHMWPIGGRVVIPLGGEKVRLNAGGGAAWLRYQERVRQPFGGGFYQIQCPPCRSRSGWGGYGLVGFSVALDRGGHFRLGSNVKVYRARTSGDAFGPLPPIETRDRWVNAAAEFSFSF